MSDSIVILGTGNLATNLIYAMISNKFDIVQIYNRSIDKAKKILDENKISCDITDNINEIKKDADIYFFTSSDNSISDIAEKLGKINGIAVHCSGTVPISVFQNISKNFAAFYPLQTFSSISNYKIDFSEIPIFIESNNKETEQKLIEISKRLGAKYYLVDEKLRQKIHLSGVFAANFANHCIAIAQDIIAENNLPTEILNPIIEQSYKKLSLISATEAQTGPARRNDSETIKKHLSLLESEEIRKEIYELLTKSIKTKYFLNE